MAASNPDDKGSGGGIIAYDESKISLGHTILAGNHDPSNLGPDLYLFPNLDFDAFRVVQPHRRQPRHEPARGARAARPMRPAISSVAP